MSIEQKCRLKWSDIEALYESLDNLKSKFPEAKVATIPEEEKRKTISQHIEDLNTAVEKVKANKYVGNKAETNLTFPLKGRIKPLYLTTIRGIIDNMAGICAHDNYRPCGDCSDCSGQRNCDSGWCPSDGGCANYDAGRGRTDSCPRQRACTGY